MRVSCRGISQIWLSLALVVALFGIIGNPALAQQTQSAPESTTLPPPVAEFDWPFWWPWPDGGSTKVRVYVLDANQTTQFYASQLGAAVSGQVTYIYEITDETVGNEQGWLNWFWGNLQTWFYRSANLNFEIDNPHSLMVNNQFVLINGQVPSDWAMTDGSGGTTIKWYATQYARWTGEAVFGFTVPAGQYQPGDYGEDNWTRWYADWRGWGTTWWGTLYKRIVFTRWVNGSLIGPVPAPVDTTPPVIIVESPSEGQTYTIADKLCVRVFVTDDESEITGVSAVINPDSANPITVPLTQDPEYPSLYTGCVDLFGVVEPTDPILRVSASNVMELTSRVDVSFNVIVTINALALLVENNVESSGLAHSLLSKLKVASEFMDSGEHVAAFNVLVAYYNEAIGLPATSPKIANDLANAVTPLLLKYFADLSVCVNVIVLNDMNESKKGGSRLKGLTQEDKDTIEGFVQKSSEIFNERAKVSFTYDKDNDVSVEEIDIFDDNGEVDNTTSPAIGNIFKTLQESGKLKPQCLNYVFVRKLKKSGVRAFTPGKKDGAYNLSVIEDSIVDDFLGEDKSKSAESANIFAHETGHQFTLPHPPQPHVAGKTEEEINAVVTAASAYLLFQTTGTVVVPIKGRKEDLTISVTRGTQLTPDEMKRIQEIAGDPKKFKLNEKK